MRNQKNTGTISIVLDYDEAQKFYNQQYDIGIGEIHEKIFSALGGMGFSIPNQSARPRKGLGLTLTLTL